MSDHERAERRTPSPGNARQVAWAVLDEHLRTGRFVAPLLDEHAASAGLAPADRRFAYELASGVTRRRSTLDAILKPHVRRPRREVEDRLWTLLRLGAYQLVLLDSVPVHAAVDETVQLARAAGKPQWSGFVNGVLRAAARTVTAETADAPAPDAVPLADGRYRRLSVAAFADPAVDPAGWFAAAFSFPPWLVRRWMARRAFDELLAIGFHFDRPSPIVLRVNRLRTTRETYLESLRAAGIAAVPGAHPAAIRLAGPARIDELPGYAEGDFSVQDESALAVCDLLDPRPGESLLDLCAAPGTKTTCLAELMRDAGTILATDVSPERLALVEANVRRLSLASVTPRLVARDGADIPAGPFDAVLVDAPCSNTGVLGRRPEARWRLKPDDLRELPGLQSRLLRAALARVKPGGRVVYATCSIEPEENAALVRGALAGRSEFELVEEASAFPGNPADGGYRALIRARPATA